MSRYVLRVEDTASAAPAGGCALALPRSAKVDDVAPATRDTFWSMVILGSLLVLGWHRTWIEMWFRWFPGWSYYGLGFFDRFGAGDSYYTHGPLVPAVSLLLAVYVYRRVGWVSGSSTGSRLAGWVVLGGSVALHLVSVMPGAGVMFTSGFAMIGVLAGWVLLHGGWPMARAYCVPIALLVFMVPLPEVAIVNLNFQLKFMAGWSAVWLTNHVFGVPAVLDGSYVYLLPDGLGQPKTLVIEDVCSGLRSLISLLWFASLFAVVCRLRGWWRWVVLGSALPVAVACNIARITWLNLVTHHFSVRAAAPEGWLHGLSGLAVFAVALLMLLGLERVVMAASRWLKRGWVDARLLGFLERVSASPGVRRWGVRWRVLPLAVLAVTAGLSLWWGGVAGPAQAGQRRVVSTVAPDSIVIDGELFVGQDHQLDVRTLQLLGNPSYLFRSFTHPRTGRRVDLLVISSVNSRSSVHPPEVCIEGTGYRITEQSFDRMILGEDGPASVKRLTARRGNKAIYFLYTYKCGDWYTDSFVAQQLATFARGWVGRSTPTGMVRLSVPGGVQDVAVLQRLATQAAEVLLPRVRLDQPSLSSTQAGL